jgi:hypothetical protein
MGKVIIGIHGLGNKPRADLLEEWWWKSIEEGLQKYTDNKFRKPKFKLVYWADVLHKSPEDENISDSDNPLFLEEKYVPEIVEHKNTEHPVRKKIIDTILSQLDNVFLNDDYSLNFSGLNDLIIENYFSDLEAYYNTHLNDKNQLIRDVLHNRLKAFLIKHKRDDVLLIAHSMGSIIAYNVLTLFARKLKIKTLITIGSPLGVPFVISKIANELHLNNRETQRPEIPFSIQKNWFNFSDLEDKVAFNYHLKDEFPVNAKGVKITDFIVSNDYTINGNHNPHKSYGYLRTPEVTSKIYSFLTEKRIPIYRRFKLFFENFILKLEK